MALTEAQKQARLRNARRAKGLVRVCVDLDQATFEKLHGLASLHGSQAQALTHLIGTAWSEMQAEQKDDT
jgi:hypothetical protein